MTKARNAKGELDTFGAILLAEGNIAGTEEETAEAWQKLINDGTCWRLQGSIEYANAKQAEEA